VRKTTTRPKATPPAGGERATNGPRAATARANAAAIATAGFSGNPQSCIISGAAATVVNCDP
jgi:hypothetical protein